MVDPFSVSTGILGLVTFGVQSVGSLISVIQDFQRSPTTIAQLKLELLALETVLKSLDDAIRDDSYDFSALELPVQQCGDACKEFERIIVKCTTHSEGNRRSIRDWTMLKYRGDDLNAFKTMLASYKATIAVALCDANLRTAKITRSALIEYKDMIQTTSCDLELRLQEIDSKLTVIAKDSRETSTQASPGRQHMEQEKQTVKQCLDICAQVSNHIDELQPVLIENLTTPPDQSFVSTAPSPRFATAKTLQSCNTQLQTASMWLKTHLEDIERQLSQPVSSLSQAAGAQKADRDRLQKEVESLQKSLQICEQAARQAEQERKNVFEDILMAEDGRQVLVSTVGDLIFARNVKAGARSIQVLGQISDNSLQQILQDGQGMPLRNSPGTASAA